MNFDHFVGQVQHRAQLADTGAALWAIQATFQTLAEELDPGEAKDVASQLPRPFHIYFDTISHSQGFSADEFFRRISEREQTTMPEAVFHARAVLEVLQEAVSPGELEEMLAQLPRDCRQILATGSTGTLKLGNGKRHRKAARKTPHEHLSGPLENLRQMAQMQADLLNERRRNL